jgi:ParB family chromosome partitioning protein
MDKYETKPSLSQAQRLKKLSLAGELTVETIDTILSEDKKPPAEEPGSQGDSGEDGNDSNDNSAGKETGLDQFREYFPESYTIRQMCDIITNLLQDWQISGISA